jgi:hypothetical protein
MSLYIPQFAEHFVHQSGFFEIYHDTTSCINKIFIYRFKNQLYRNGKNQIEKDPITFYWRVT